MNMDLLQPKANLLDQWLLIKFYHCCQLKELFKQLIIPFTQSMKEQDCLDQYFFFQFKTHFPCVHFYIFPNPPGNFALVKTILDDIFQRTSITNTKVTLEANQSFPNFLYTEYFIERKFLEKHFHESSNTILKLMDNSSSWSYQRAFAYSLPMQIRFIRPLMPNYGDAAIFFQQIYEQKLRMFANNYRSEATVNRLTSIFEQLFQKQIHIVNNAIKKYWNNEISQIPLKQWSTFSNTFAYQIILQLSHHRTGSALNQKVKKEDFDRQLFKMLHQLYHGTNNRLGVSTKDELFLTYLLWRGLEKGIKI